MWLTLLTIGAAEARWPRHLDLLLPDATDDTLLEGPREPAVAYSEGLDAWVVVWSYLDPTLSDPDCPDGVWSLAYATSPDGLSWTPEGPLLQPTPGSGDYWQCMARHPTAVFDDTDALLVWFVANQGTFAVPSQTGLGVAEIELDATTLTPTSTIVSSSEALVGDSFTAPSAVLSPTHATVVLQDSPDILVATGPPDALTLAAAQAISLGRFGTISWLGDELWNPSLVCEDNLIFPYTMLLGGRLQATGEWRLGWTISSTAMSWVLPIDHSFTDPQDLRSFDVLGLGTGDYLVYLEVPGPAGTDAKLMAASSVATWTNSDVSGEVCP